MTRLSEKPNLRFRRKEITQNYACGTCGFTFTQESHLKQHTSDFHERRIYKCERCSRKFTSIKWLKKHRLLHDRNYKCDRCSQKFAKASSLTRHLLRHDNRYACTFCEKFFEDKHDLTSHESVAHKKLKSYGCAKCDKRFERKDVLLNHIKRCYDIEEREDRINTFECDKCHRTFERKAALCNHLKRCMYSTRRKHLDTLKCVLCDSSFGMKKHMLNHIYRMHPQVRIEQEHRHFDTIDEFKKWKAEIERTTITSFRQRTVKQLQRHTLRSYTCHRSGKFQPKQDRARRLKVQGSKKINGYCPAEMKLSTNKRDGTCEVTYVKTHLGHKVGDVNELVHISLSKEERCDIATKISTGIPYGKILDETGESSGGHIDRLSLLNNKDLHNIAATFGLKHPSFNSSKDLSNAETFIRQNADCVLYYKLQNRIDSKYGALQADDVIVVLMSPQQKELVERYGSKVVAMDGTQRAQEDSFFIHVILVIDDSNEALIAAAAVTNKNNDRLIDVFLRCVKEKIISWQTTIFMSDWHGSYPDSWLRIMGEPTYSFRCIWHVRETWQNSLCKIAIGEKRAQMQALLHRLLTLTDETEFRKKLDDLITNTDPDLQKFLEYFRKYYYHNFDQWAYCYRMQAGEHTNAYFESFSDTCKCVKNLRTKVKCLSSCLYSLKRYTTSTKRKVTSKLLRPKYSFKLRKLRVLHDEITAKNLETVVIKDSARSWLVSVSGSEEQRSVYFVSATNKKCENCEYYCEKCRACLHMYECSCLDFTIKGHMCTHVHGLCLFLKNEREQSLDGKEKNDPRDTDSEETWSAISELSWQEREENSRQIDSEETWSLISEPLSVQEEILVADHNSMEETVNSSKDRNTMNLKCFVGDQTNRDRDKGLDKENGSTEGTEQCNQDRSAMDSKYYVQEEIENDEDKEWKTQNGSADETDKCHQDQTPLNSKSCFQEKTIGNEELDTKNDSIDETEACDRITFTVQEEINGDEETRVRTLFENFMQKANKKPSTLVALEKLMISSIEVIEMMEETEDSNEFRN